MFHVKRGRKGLKVGEMILDPTRVAPWPHLWPYPSGHGSPLQRVAPTKGQRSFLEPLTATFHVKHFGLDFLRGIAVDCRPGPDTDEGPGSLVSLPVG
jgi:hypothetical protein